MLGIIGGIASTIGSLISSSSQKEKAPDDTVTLKQEDFMKLVMAQIQNQSPLKPFDSNTMMQQVSQLASLSNNENLTNSINGLSKNIISNQAMSASQMVGREVQVQSNTSALIQGEGLKGSVLLEQPVSDVKISIQDASGQVVKELNLGQGEAGNFNFKWDGIADDGQGALPGVYKITATGTVNGEAVNLPTAAISKVASVTFSPQGSGLVLNLQGLGNVDLQSVSSFL